MKKTICCTMMLAALIASGIARADNAKVNWRMECAECHGKNGRGNTPAGRMLHVPDYRKANEQAKFTDEEAFKAIKDGIVEDGRRRMKAFGDRFTDKDIKELVQYMRSFKKTD